MNPPTDLRIPVTVLTGFLGAGKTTLLNHLLTTQHGRRIAVIENEFGEIGIDHELVINADEEVFEMNNGCICCTVRGDLIRILLQLLKRRDRFDYILVETTGLADPGPVAQTFLVDDEIKASFRLDGIVTLVDARHVLQHLDDSEECQAQIAFADTLLLNKVDLVSEPDLRGLETRLRTMNAGATLIRAQHAKVPADQVVNIHAFDLGQKLAIAADFLQEELPFEWGGLYELEVGNYEWTLQPGPDPTMDLVLLPVDGSSAEDLHAQRLTALRLFSGSPTSLADGGLVLPSNRLYRLELTANAPSRFGVLIPRPGRYGLFTQHGPEEFQMTFEQGGQPVALKTSRTYSLPGHEHDETVTSVGWLEDRPLQPEKLNAWLSGLLQSKGADLFRMKGVLYLQDSPNRFVFQGVHMLFEGRMDRAWKPGERRCSQLVFIGRNLDRAALTEGFHGCLV